MTTDSEMDIYKLYVLNYGPQNIYMEQTSCIE